MKVWKMFSFSFWSDFQVPAVRFLGSKFNLQALFQSSNLPSQVLPRFPCGYYRCSLFADHPLRKIFGDAQQARWILGTKHVDVKGSYTGADETSLRGEKPMELMGKPWTLYPQLNHEKQLAYICNQIWSCFFLNSWSILDARAWQFPYLKGLSGQRYNSAFW